MFNKLMDEGILIATAIVGLAMVAVLVGKNAQTSSVIKSAGDALAADIGAAVKPVT
jgi:hypothetical protein